MKIAPQNLLFKFSAIFLSVCLAFPPTFCIAAPAFPPGVFKIPGKLGILEESGKGASGKTIIYIQDAHDSLDAQVSIAGLIDQFVNKKGVETVFAEGYEGLAPSDQYFGFIKNTKMKEKVSYFLMDKLRLGGAEYAHINRKTDFKLIGIDNEKLHTKNLEAYKKAAKRRKAIAKDLSLMRREINRLIELRFSNKFKAWIKLKNRYHAGKAGLVDYLLRTPPAKTFPSLNLLLSAEENSARVKKIDPSTFFQELDLMENAMAGGHLKNELDQKIFNFDKTLELLERLNRLEVTAPEYHALKQSLTGFNTRKVADFIALHGGKSVLLFNRWEESIKHALQFYEIAHARDHALESKLNDFKKAAEQAAVLVFGGFHKNSVLEILRKNGFSYQVITPTIKKIDPRHQSYYKQLMETGYLPFEHQFLPGKAARQDMVFKTKIAIPEIMSVYKLFYGPSAEPRSELRVNLPVPGPFRIDEEAIAKFFVNASPERWRWLMGRPWRKSELRSVLDDEIRDNFVRPIDVDLQMWRQLILHHDRNAVIDSARPDLSEENAPRLMLERGRNAAETLRDFIFPEDTVLDIGSGPKGGFAFILALRGAHVTSFEKDPKAIQALKEKYEKLRPDIEKVGGRWQVIQGDFSNPKDRKKTDQKFQHIIATDVVYPLAKHQTPVWGTDAIPTTDIDEIESILNGIAGIKDKEGGIVLFSIPTANDPLMRYYRGQLEQKISSATGSTKVFNRFVSVPFSLGIQYGHISIWTSGLSKRQDRHSEFKSELRSSQTEESLLAEIERIPPGKSLRAMAWILQNALNSMGYQIHMPQISAPLTEFQVREITENDLPFPGGPNIAIYPEGVPGLESSGYWAVKENVGVNFLFVPSINALFTGESQTNYVYAKYAVFVNKKGELVLGIFKEPVPVHSIEHAGIRSAPSTQLFEERGIPILNPPAMRALLNDKIEFGKFLQESGIATPPFLAVKQNGTQTIEEDIRAFIAKENAVEFVLKPVSESGGSGVRMFKADETAQAAAYALELFQRHEKIILQKRVVNSFWVEREILMDWNLRVLTTWNKDELVVNPDMIEVRFQPKSGKPVNKSVGANVITLREFWLRLKFSEADKIRFMDQIQQIMTAAAEKLEKALTDQRGPSMAAYKNTGLIGWDLILDENNLWHVIEANSGSVGGVQTIDTLVLQKDKGKVVIPIMRHMADLGFIYKGKHSHIPNQSSGMAIPLPRDENLLQSLYMAFHFTQEPQIAEALARFNMLIAQSSKNWLNRAKHNLAYILQAQERFDEAAQLYRETLETDPSDIQTLFNLGLTLQNQNKHDEALPYYKKILENDPNHVNALNNLASIHLNYKKYKAARSLLLRSIKINKTGYAYYLLGYIDASRGNWLKAEKSYRKAVRLQPDMLTTMAQNISQALHQLTLKGHIRVEDIQKYMIALEQQDYKRAKKYISKAPLSTSELRTEISGNGDRHKRDLKQEIRAELRGLLKSEGNLWMSLNAFSSLTREQTDELFAAMKIRSGLRLNLYGNPAEITHDKPGQNAITRLQGTRFVNDADFAQARKRFGTSGAHVRLLTASEAAKYKGSDLAFQLTDRTAVIELAGRIASGETSVLQKGGLYDPPEFLLEVTRSGLRHRVIAYSA